MTRDLLQKWRLNAIGEAEPCSLEEWAEFFEHGDRVLAQTEIGDAQVSTVFMGFDQGHYEDRPPVLWESLVMDGPLDGTMARYETRLQAQQGHEALCERVRNVPNRQIDLDE